MPSYHFQIYAAGVPTERYVDVIEQHSNRLAAERRLDKMWDAHGSPRCVATLATVKPAGDVEQFHQIGPFGS